MLLHYKYVKASIKLLYNVILMLFGNSFVQS